MRLRIRYCAGMSLWAAACVMAAAGCEPLVPVTLPPTWPSTSGTVQTSDQPADNAPPADTTCDAIGQPRDSVHEQMFRLLNNYRTGKGLPALEYSKTLEAAADEHARDMWRRNFFEHTNPDGEGPGDRALRAGFCHRYVGENIAEGNGLPTAGDAQIAWVNSPGHNANMLYEPYRLVGMGHYYDAKTGYHYWVQDMAYPVRE